ncbi:universal stress protein [Amycolatopsis methanolica]|uniref:Universal stress protein n=1 Tax=Amycolatopsis methanolica 239 TaxID=1068978 RepID=A0A076MRD6_AMYME|nr:universal stress protein [Amycolatopsis methanolica]AIJ23189.1 universal stress protein [Amycolatopsis methanolica 239]
MNTSNAKYAIVVGIDGSGESLRAVRWAAAAARLRHEPLHIVYGFAPLSGFYGAGMPVLQNAYDDLVRAGERVVAEAVGAAREITGEHVRITSEMPNEPAAPLLVERSRNARMIALGSSGTGGFTGMLIGSTTVAVSAHAACPVVVVRGRDAESGPVVVGVDGSPSGERALAMAFEEACRRETPLVAVHVWSDDQFTGFYGSLPLALDWEEIERDEQRLLAERLAGWQEEYPDVKVERVVVRDRPRHQLVEWSGQAQLVVVGSRGRGGFTGLLLGSTSQALIHHAECPVMVVRP